MKRHEKVFPAVIGMRQLFATCSLQLHMMLTSRRQASGLFTTGQVQHRQDCNAFEPCQTYVKVDSSCLFHNHYLLPGC